jgi:predicted dithiol-disulfide oxidoreductase (DUF899 family)
MNYKETAGKLAEYRSQIADIHEKMRSARASIEPEEVQDYEFATPKGTARLSALFGDKDTFSSSTIWAPPARIARCGPMASMVCSSTCAIARLL